MKESEQRAKILEFLKKDDKRHFSGEDISGRLGVSRAYVWKIISRLRDDGYSIEGSSNLGYILRSSPGKVYDYEIKCGLNTEKFGKKNIYYHVEAGSTNDVAYLLAEEGAEEGTVVVSEKQSGGKGRLGRKWVSPRGGIYMSLVLRPDMPLEDIPAVTLVAAVSTARAVRLFSGLEALIKWPNDIYIGGCKTGGILSEVKAHPDKVDFIVVGIGVNVNTPANRLPAGGTSLKEAAGRPFDRPGLLRTILECFETDYLDFKEKGFAAARNTCRELSCIMNNKVSIEARHMSLEGTVVDIDERGALMVEDAHGSIHRIFSGDVRSCG